MALSVHCNTLIPTEKSKQTRYTTIYYNISPGYGNRLLKTGMFAYNASDWSLVIRYKYSLFTPH